MSELNKQIALKFLEAMGSADQATAASCLAVDAFTLTKGFCKFSGERDAKTMVEMIGQFKTLMPTGLRLTFTTVTAGDDRVVVEAEGNAVTSQGAAYCNQYCFVFTMADGKVKQLNEYLCTKLAEEALWPSVKALEGQQPSA